ncbi:hypothetical protein PanWU01x14_006550 [Parasponia andersonii]|uniref:Uncharacterized protein n=1 Tax=Parasponia andersonii TaxID=3476 RepID=A0A2P5E3U5_PARAD|nr:hypothetical protein PanWU01x14_006550 [Parasponia andersonii]
MKQCAVCVFIWKITLLNHLKPKLPSFPDRTHRTKTMNHCRIHYPIWKISSILEVIENSKPLKHLSVLAKSIDHFLIRINIRITIYRNHHMEDFGQSVIVLILTKP